MTADTDREARLEADHQLEGWLDGGIARELRNLARHYPRSSFNRALIEEGSKRLRARQRDGDGSCRICTRPTDGVTLCRYCDRMMGHLEGEREPDAVPRSLLGAAFIQGATWFRDALRKSRTTDWGSLRTAARETAERLYLYTEPPADTEGDAVTLECSECEAAVQVPIEGDLIRIGTHATGWTITRDGEFFCPSHPASATPDTEEDDRA